MSALGPRQGLAFELGVLVDVAGVERGVLVGRRIGDVTVDTAGAAVDDAAGPSRARAVDHVLDAGDVDGAIGAVWLTGFPVRRGDVMDDVDALTGGGDRSGVGQVAGGNLHADVPQGCHLGPIEAAGTDQPADRHPSMPQVAREVTAGEPGDAGDQDGHRGSRPPLAAGPVTAIGRGRGRIDASSIA